MSPTHHRIPYLAGVLVAVIFGMSFLFTKNALDLLEPLSVMSFRFALAALVLSLLALFRIIRIDLKGKPLKDLLLLTLFQPLLYFTFETWGVSLTSSSEAGILISLVPVAVVVFGYIFLKEKISLAQGIFILVSLSGILFISLKTGLSASLGHTLGYLALLGAVLSGAMYNVMAKKASSRFTPVETTFVMMWVGAIAFNGVLLLKSLFTWDFSQYAIPFSSLPTCSSILYLGVLSSICAFFMLNYMLSKLPSYQCAVFLNLTPVVSVIAGVLFRHEVLFSYHLIGFLLIIAGVAGTNLGGAKPPKKPLDGDPEVAP